MCRNPLAFPLFSLALFLLLLATGSLAFERPKYATAVLSTGRVRGYVVEPSANRTDAVNVFKGIPFAQAPVGALRFRTPRPAASWFGVWNATYYRPACPSNTSNTRSPQHNTNEDCLYVNVFAPQSCAQKSCPILTLFHGGGFYYDSATMFDDDFLVENYASKGIVVVIPAYRLGVFGFLDLGDDRVLPRNLGMHDMVMSLKWLQKEGHAFGGDPMRVTLLGNSAGGDAILFLSAAKNVPLMWSQIVVLSARPQMLQQGDVEISRWILERADCLTAPGTNETLPSAQQLDCLRRLPWKQLLQVQRDAEDANLLFWGPHKDRLLFGEQTFTQSLPDFKPATAWFSVTRDEYDMKPEEFYGECREYGAMFDYYENATFNACIEHYKAANGEGLVRMAPDAQHSNAYRLGRLLVGKEQRVYLANFEVEGHTHHSNDMTFLVGLHPVEGEMTLAESMAIKYMPQALRNFINYGVPDKDWPTLSKEGENYEVIEFVQEATTVRGPHPVLQPYFPEAVAFWLEDLALVEKEARLEHVMNRSADAREQWEKVQEKERQAKWDKFRELWNRTRELSDQKERTAEAGMKEEQEEKVRRFIDYLLSHSLQETVEDLEKLREKLKEEEADDGKIAEIDEIVKKLKDLIDDLNDTPVSDGKEDEEKDGEEESEEDEDPWARALREADRIAAEKAKNATKMEKKEWERAQEQWKRQREAIKQKRNETRVKQAQERRERQEQKAEEAQERKEEIRERIQEWNESRVERQKEREQIQEEMRERRKEIEERKNETRAEFHDAVEKDIQEWNKTRAEVQKEKEKSAQSANQTREDVRKRINETNADIARKLNDTWHDVAQEVNETRKEVVEKETEQAEREQKMGKELADRWQQAHDRAAQRWRDQVAEWNASLSDWQQKEKERQREWEKRRKEAQGRWREAQRKLRNRTKTDDSLVDGWRREGMERFKEHVQDTEPWHAMLDGMRNETRGRVLERVRDFVSGGPDAWRKRISTFLQQKTLERLRNRKNSDPGSNSAFNDLLIAFPPAGGGAMLPEDASLPLIPSGSLSEAAQAWSAFWIMTWIAVLLASALCILSCARCLCAPKRPSGYYYNEDPGIFSEKSRIVIASYPQYT